MSFGDIDTNDENPLLNGTAFEVQPISELASCVINYKVALTAEKLAAHNLAEAHRQLAIAQQNYDVASDLCDEATEALLAAAEAA